MRTFTEQVTDNAAFNNTIEQQFVYDFLLMISTQTVSFEFVLEFMGDQEKELIRNLIEKLSLVESSKLREHYKV